MSSLKEVFRRNGTSTNFLRKQAKEKISISKSKIWKKISRYRKSDLSQRILCRRVASGAEEETRRRNRRDLLENKTTRKKRKRKAKAVITVGRQEHTLQAEIDSALTIDSFPWWLQVLPETEPAWMALPRQCRMVT